MDRETARKRAVALVEQMTVEEMASQLRFDAPAVERLGIPEYNWWNEGLHGVARGGTATIFPQAIGLGATFDEELLEEIGRATAMEARAKYNEAIKYDDRDIYKGLTLWSPNVNIFRDPRWGRGHETYGEDPYLAARMGVAFINGLQGKGEYLLTAACAKHYAVHSGPEALRHHFDATASRKDMWETYLPAFEACVQEADVEAVMGAYNRTNGEPCCAHDYLMNEVLRGKWGFAGHYVSDCWAIRDFHENHEITGRPEESVELALKMGCDLNCGCTYEKILDAYQEGLIDPEWLKRSAVRLFTTRFLLGMFDETEMDCIPYETVECKEHLNLASRAARESIVLLKNDGILPINKDKVKTIGVIGPNADSRAALIGNYHGTSSRYITVLDGIQNAAGDDIRVLYSIGSHLYLDREEKLARPDDRLSEAKTVAAHSDLVVLCLGLDEGLEGEEGDMGNAYSSGDKADMEFPASQLRLLETVAASGVPFILCVMTGSAMNLCYASEHAGAILQTWYPGGRGGRDVADIIFGKAQPSGKLPVTLYKNLDGMPDFTDYSLKNRTYRYVEREPLYPFGYGLTYGSGEITGAEMTSLVSYEEAAKEGVSLKVFVRNTSEVVVEEVVQVYVRVEGSTNEVPNHKLACFKRVVLLPKEEKELLLSIGEKAFTTVDEEGNYVADGTGASVYVGFSQPDQRSCSLTGQACLKLMISG